MKSEKMETITNGPSKFDLMVALFDGKIVEFTIKRTYTESLHKIRIEGGTRNNPDGEWEIIGQVKHFYKNTWATFKAVYDMRTRKGPIRIDGEIDGK